MPLRRKNKDKNQLRLLIKNAYSSDSIYRKMAEESPKESYK